MRIVILILLISFYTLISAREKVTQDFVVSEVTRIYDGDTITVNLDCNEMIFCKDISVRIYGIDTPELHGGTNTHKEKYLAKLARKITINFIRKSKKIYLNDCFRGKYFRIVCKVINDEGRYLEDVLINSTLAVPYFGGTKTKNWGK